MADSENCVSQPGGFGEGFSSGGLRLGLLGYISDCYIFLVNCFLSHYEMSLLISDNAHSLNIYLAHIDIATPPSLDNTLHMIYFLYIYLQFLMALYYAMPL